MPFTVLSAAIKGGKEPVPYVREIRKNNYTPGKSGYMFLIDQLFQKGDFRQLEDLMVLWQLDGLTFSDTMIPWFKRISKEDNLSPFSKY